MPTALELLREDRIEELWQKCCGFIDLSMEQFMAIQHERLLEQIETLKKCELGNKLIGGANPRTVEEFRQRVPLTTYADYIPYLSEKMDDTLPGKPIMWNRTSGRSDEYSFKWVPTTRRMYEELGDTFLSLLVFASCRDRGDIVLEEHDKFLYGLAPPPYASGFWGRRAEEEGIFKFLPHPDVADKMEFRERMEAGFKLGMSEGIDMMAAIASVLVAVGERFGQGGGLNRLIPVLKQPKILMRLVKAMLKSKMARRHLLPKDIWSLKGLVSAGTDSYVYREKIKEMWGRYPLDVYGATETVLIAAQTWDYGSMTFFPYFSFLEFIPEKEHAKWAKDTKYQPQILQLDEVMAGERYIVVATNFLGGSFVRYVLGDVLTITSLRNDKLNINQPQATFYGRADDIIDFEAFSHAFFTEKIVWQAIANSGFNYVDWVVRKEVIQETPMLHLYVEPKEADFNDEAGLTSLLHEELKRLNPDYDDLERFFGLKPLKVTLLRGGAFEEYMAKKREAGADLAHLKPPHMKPSDSIIEALGAKSQMAPTPSPMSLT